MKRSYIVVLILKDVETVPDVPPDEWDWSTLIGEDVEVQVVLPVELSEDAAP